MLEIGTSGLMSGEGKRGVAAWPKLPRPSSTLPMEGGLECQSGRPGGLILAEQIRLSSMKTIGAIAPLHPERHRRAVLVLEAAVARQRPEREEFRVAVVAQVEDARETGRGVARLVPEAVSGLVAQQIVDAALHRRAAELAGGHQAEHRP